MAEKSICAGKEDGGVDECKSTEESQIRHYGRQIYSRIKVFNSCTNTCRQIHSYERL